MLRVLVIDDVSDRHMRISEIHKGDEVHCIYGCDTACQAVVDEEFDIIYLDHDAGAARPVYDSYRPVASVIAAKYGNGSRLGNYPEVRVHSSNPDGAKWLVMYLKRYGIKAGFYNPYAVAPHLRGPSDDFDIRRAWKL